MPKAKKVIVAPFPPKFNFGTPPILHELAQASRSLGEMRGTAKSLPNPNILIDTLFLQEALASSAIESIVTTQDEAFRADLISEYGSPEAKEVARYREAIQTGYKEWQQLENISENMIIKMFRTLKDRDDGYRTTPGTVLRNEQTDKTIYTPPDPAQIISLMRELEIFINDTKTPLDPLIKMALIHHQFETIHPFPDGNGRVGRMLNILYLTHAGLLDAPILYLSRAINSSKSDYYRLLQSVRDNGEWEEWVIYILRAIDETARSTLHLIEGIRDLMHDTKQRMRSELPNIYSQDLLNNLFRHPYTRIDYLMNDIGKSRPTVTDYLKQLTDGGFLAERKEGRNKYYINTPLIALLLENTD